MSIKDFFNRSSQVIVSSSLELLAEDAESPGYIDEYNQKQDIIQPHIDFSKPENFAKFGSAAEYYDKSLEYIYGEYPYDGSLKEKTQWRNHASLLDIYLFDNRYPKTTGYAVFSSDGWGTLTGSRSGGYGAPATEDYEYINIKGGPNSVYGSALGTASIADIFDSRSNIFDQTVTGSSGPVTANRESNLETNLNKGVTVEFWLQTGSLSNTITDKQVIFDLWNGEASSSAGYGRLRIEASGTVAGGASGPFLVTAMSGTSGYFQQSIGSGLDQNTLSSWGHYAFSFINSGSTIITRLYHNGDLNDTLTTGTNIGKIREDIEANIGALVAAPSGNVYHNTAITEGWGKLSGSIDEFRFWKTRRTEKQIKRNYFTSDLGGGTNTDTANLDLGVYYKFNEGIVGDDSIDNTVLDYSGRISNGTWNGYPSSNSRNTGSAINSASAGTEELDPILRPSHAAVVALSEELQLSGSLWDYENNSSLYYTMPTWVIEEDEGNGTTGDLKKLTQIMSTYLDNLDVMIGELSKFNVASYPSSSINNEGQPHKSFQPYPYAQTAVKSFGMDAPELFSNSNILEYYRNRDETKEYEEDLYTVKNLIYNNIYNNLVDIYKAKGTEKAFRNLIRCFGIGEDLLRINAYANNDTYKFETKRRATSVKTKAINFNHIDRFAGTVYQYADTSNANSVSYISGSSGLGYEDSFPITIETEIVFPKKVNRSEEYASTQEFGSLTASLFGVHTAQGTSPTETDLTWASSDIANLQVFAIRDTKYSDDVKFMLTSSVPYPIPELTSSFYQNTYNNEKWNFAVRIKPHGYPQSFVSGALDSENNYVVEFYGVSYIADRMINEFVVTGSLAKSTAENFLTAPKRLFVGSHKTNFTGSTLQYSDVKVTSCRYWFDYLDNDTIKDHAIDPNNFGHMRPSRNSYLLETDLPNAEVPELESLALYWDFQTVTGSDNGSGVATTFDGKFTVEDVTSGSLSQISRYGWLGKILRYQHTARGDAFPINSTGSVETLYLYSGKQQLPETVFGDDNIRVLSREETEVFTKETRPIKTYYAFEKSMYQVISDEIINYFGSIVDFNNLVGEPVNRYRPEYKSLKYLRQFFFERVKNTPDLDKFVEYYKWADSTLETMLMQLVPASAQVSDGIDNVIESHVLERNKYHNKFPTLEFNTPDPEGCAISINKHLYDWEHGHRPLSGLESDNCLYWKERAERNVSPINSGDANVDSDRTSILSASLQVLERQWCTPYRYTVDKSKVLHGGINYSENKKTNFYRGINYPHGPRTSIGLPVNVLIAFRPDVTGLKDCDDDLIPEELQKRKYTFGTKNARTNDSGSLDGIKGEIAMPFNILSASAGIGGYNKQVQNRYLSGSQLVNLHSDAYGATNETPMQGTFTEKYVGGHQHRHIRLNNYDSARVGGDGLASTNNIDNQYTRPEAWRLLLGGGPLPTGALGLTGPDYGGPYPDPQRYRAWWWREETAKRPVNIKNILQTTASVDLVLSGALEHGPLGNYQKTYQIVQSSGRSTNNFWFNNNGVTLPERFANNNPKTTNVHTLVAVRPTTGGRARGNTFIPMAGAGSGTPATIAARKLSNRYDPYQNDVPADRTVFPLPSRDKQHAVIVERFSAPGGPEINSLGFLDVMAAEKSVYNALPYRNLSVRGSGSGEDVKFAAASEPISVSDHLGNRRGLRTLSNLHTGRFGSDATYGSITEANYVTSPSYYKDNRNARLRIEYSQDQGYFTASNFDTWHIQHPIPQNDFQYAWISASISNNPAAQVTAFGHAPKSGKISGSEGFEEAISFMISTTDNYEAVVAHNGLAANQRIELDFVGLNTLVYDPTGSAFNILSASVASAAGYRNLQIATGGVYVNPTVNEGTLIPVDPFNLLMIHRNGPYGHPSWKQIDHKYHPLVRQMRANNTISTIDPETLPNRTRFTYKGYHWEQGIQQTNDSIFGYESKGKFFAEATQDRSVLTYHEPVLLQKFKVMDFKYADRSSFASTVQDKAFNIRSTHANQKKFFANSKLNDNLNVNEYRDSSADIVIEASSIIDTDTPLLTARYAESVYPRSINVYRSHIRQRTTFANDFWRDDRTERQVINKENSQGINVLSSSMWPLDARYDFANTSSPGVKAGRQSRGVDRGDGPQLGGGEGELQNSYNLVHSLGSQQRTVLVPGDPPTSTTYLAAGCGDRYTGGPVDITASATYNRRQTLPTGSSARSYSSFLGNDNVTKVDGVIVFTGDAPWDAARQANKYPFYDSYGEYVEEMKRYGKDYSIVPEYRMSERIDDYLINNVDKFNDSSVFSLTGGLANTTSSSEEDFYKVYSHSDFMKYFTVTHDKLDDIGLSLDELTVTCEGLLKFLPYDGFYPASRTLQLATLFSKSYGDNVYCRRENPTNGALDEDYPQAYFRPFLTPMFAPGILYNTIKSGIAVDFPILTGSNALPQQNNFVTASMRSFGDNTTLNFNYLIANDNFSTRIPFEALVEPEEHLKGFNIYDMEVHPSCSINATASWDGQGDSRYKRAMSNFLAETPEFFLDNGTFTSFFSKPVEQWNFVKDRTYKMRVRIQKSFKQAKKNTTNKVIQDTPQIVSGTETMCMYSRPTAFGPPTQGAIGGYTDDGQGTDVPGPDLNYGYGGGSLEGYNAPFTPPYYDGAAWADMIYVPDSNNPTLEDVLAGITTTYIRYSGTGSYAWQSTAQSGSFSGYNAATPNFGPTGSQNGVNINNNTAQVSASVNLFGKSTGLTQLNRYQGFESSNTGQWVIQTKFETPILNFIDVSSSATVIENDGECSGGAETRPYGMWHQYGRLPTGSEGITLHIEDDPTPQIGAHSLADAVGFAKTSQKLGRVAEKKTIREAVVAVPFYESLLFNRREFFPIDRGSIEVALGKKSGGSTPSGAPNTTFTLTGESITQMVESMQKYVFPPSMDFISYPDKVNPFVMYIFDFEYDLNQEDLVDIWQNLPPRIGRSFQGRSSFSSQDPDLPNTGVDAAHIHQIKQITHKLDFGQLLSREDITAKKRPPIQWMVFKVKQKAKKSYFSKVVEKNTRTYAPDIASTITTFDPKTMEIQGVSTTTPLQPLAPNAINKGIDTLELISEGAGKGGITVDNIEAEYYDPGYNWPYDFFSLVELVKVTQELKYTAPEEVLESGGVQIEPGDRFVTSNKGAEINIRGNSMSPGPVDTFSEKYATKNNELIRTTFEMADSSAPIIVPKIVAWFQAVEQHMLDVGPTMQTADQGISSVKHNSDNFSTDVFGAIVTDPTNEKIKYHIKGVYDPHPRPKTSTGLDWNYTISKILI